MAAKKHRSFLADFRLFFLRGLGILLPSIVTLGLLLWAFAFLRDRVAEPMNGLVRQSVIFSAPKLLPVERLPEWFRVSDVQVQSVLEERTRLGQPRLTEDQVRRIVRSKNLKDYWQERWYLRGIGFVVAIVLVYLAGVLLGGIIGRRIYHAIESFFIRLPIIKQVYPNVKQITDFLIGSGKNGSRGLPAGSSVVLVEYPRKGIWTVGLLTGETLKAIEDLSGVPCVTVFIPSSPTPFTGYTITVPRAEVYPLPLTLDEAIRFVVSGGVLVPDRQRGSETPPFLSAGASGTDTEDSGLAER